VWSLCALRVVNDVLPRVKPMAHVAVSLISLTCVLCVCVAVGIAPPAGFLGIFGGAVGASVGLLLRSLAVQFRCTGSREGDGNMQRSVVRAGRVSVRLGFLDCGRGVCCVLYGFGVLAGDFAALVFGGERLFSWTVVWPRCGVVPSLNALCPWCL
jgi:hypothetical protein